MSLCPLPSLQKYKRPAGNPTGLGIPRNSCVQRECTDCFLASGSGALAFHLLISHLGYIGLPARMFDGHAHQIALGAHINVYILVYLFGLRYRIGGKLHPDGIRIDIEFNPQNILNE